MFDDLKEIPLFTLERDFPMNIVWGRGMAGGGGMAGENDSSMGGDGTAGEGASNAGGQTDGSDGSGDGGFGWGYDTGARGFDVNNPDFSVPTNPFSADEMAAFEGLSETDLDAISAAVSGRPSTRGLVSAIGKLGIKGVGFLGALASGNPGGALAMAIGAIANPEDFNTVKAEMAYQNAMSKYGPGATPDQIAQETAQVDADFEGMMGGDGNIDPDKFGDHFGIQPVKEAPEPDGWGTDIAREKYTRFEDYYNPIETDLMAGLFDPTKREEQATEAAGISRQQFDNSFRALQQNNARYGQPSTDVRDFQNRRMEIESALGSTQAANDVRSMTFDRDLTTGQGLSAMARGLSGQVTSVDGQLSNMELQRKAFGEQAANQASQQRAETWGTAAGLAYSALDSWGKS